MKEKKLTDEEIVKVLGCCIKEEHKDCMYCGEYVSQFDCMRNAISNALDLIHRQKAEIERLTKWKDKLQDTKDELEQQLIDTGFKEYCEENKRLTEENAELQKQVVELKERAKIDIENEKNWGKIQTKQAVKDTAKEIWDDITSYYFSLRVLGNATVELDKLAEFWYKRGVEVE